MKILIVAPFFPPYSSVAVVRIASLTRYMIKIGYDITVLTNKIENGEKKINMNDELDSIHKIEVDISSSKGRGYVRRKLYENKFHEIMSVNKFDCVLMTCGPFYTVPLCEISKKVYNTKCIIDFRDLWIFDIRSMKKFLSPKNLLRKIIFFPIEKKAIKYADKVITVTNGWRDILKRVYPKYSNKMEVIYNGFDDEYLKGLKTTSTNKNQRKVIGNGNFNIMVFGKLAYYSKDFATRFFRALVDIRKNYKNVQLIQIGSREVETNDIIKEVNYPLDGYINTGFMDYAEGMSLLNSADVTVIIDIRKKAIGTKIYDYIYLNKPIIYIGNKNTYLSDFVSSFENGFSCQTEKDIRNAIEYIIKNNVENLSSQDESSKFSRQFQNERFVELIENI